VTGAPRVGGSGTWPVVRLRGEIDLSNVEALYKVAEDAVTNHDAGLVVDLSGVTFLDSTGLRLVFRLARRLGDRQQNLRLVVPEGARIARVLDFAGVSTVAEVLRTYDPDASDERGARA
jgi:anti-anti-sigma factor